MMNDLEVLRKLWRGEGVVCQSGNGVDIEVKTRPQPVQPELPIWLTAGGTPATFAAAGKAGTNLLTHLLGQDFSELAKKITIYREAWRQAGHPGKGHVTLMIHTFVHQDMDFVKAVVREPFKQYLRSSVDLIVNLAKAMGRSINVDRYTED